MKQQTLEKKILAHMLDNMNSLDLVLDNGITTDFFWYHLPNSNKALYAGLFDIIIETRYQNGSVLTEDVLIDKMENRLTANKGIVDIDKQKAKIMSYYSEIKLEPINEDLIYLIQKIKEQWNKKVMAQMSTQMQLLQKDAEKENADHVWTHTGQNLVKFLEENIVSTTKGSSIKTRDLMRDTDLMISELKERIANPEKYQGVFIGLPPIDDVTNGFRPGQLIVFIGQVASGKTTLLTNLGYNACNKFKKNVLFFSLEMLEWMMISKFNARDIGVDYDKFRDGKLSKDEQRLVFKRLEERKKESAGFFHKEMAGGCSVTDIEREIRKMFMQEPIDVVFVDYLGIISPSPQSGSQRWEQLGRNVEKLRQLAQEYNVPIITAVQANRETIKSVRNEVKSSGAEHVNFGVESVAESITIANTADIIFGITTDFEENKMWIHQVKNREGNTKKFSLTLQASRSYVGYDGKSNDMDFLTSDSIIDDYDINGLSTEDLDIIKELEDLDLNKNKIKVDDDGVIQEDDLDDVDIDIDNIDISSDKEEEEGLDDIDADDDSENNFGDLDGLDELFKEF